MAIYTYGTHFKIKLKKKKKTLINITWVAECKNRGLYKLMALQNRLAKALSRDTLVEPKYGVIIRDDFIHIRLNNLV